jgi:hypothetical protein
MITALKFRVCNDDVGKRIQYGEEHTSVGKKFSRWDTAAPEIAGALAAPALLRTRMQLPWTCIALAIHDGASMPGLGGLARYFTMDRRIRHDLML